METLIFFLALYSTMLFITAVIAEFTIKFVEKAVEIALLQLIISCLWTWLFDLLYF